uniref:inositol-phosphate phosphatase n=1 Tax=Romanomermis culicivorax TaxID=13658 RepID=A0A915L6L5_ROMCU
MIISEEKTSIGEESIEPYRENNYFKWQTSKNLIKNLPKNDRYLLSDLLVYVDPLDATQEFSEDLLEYVTVMLCVTVRGKPIVGVIHRPFFNETVVGLVDHGVYPENYRNFQQNAVDSPKVVIVSRSHGGKVKALLSDAFTTDANQFRIESAGGSGYKALRLVNRTADFYTHVTQLKKWDACAPDALVRAAGGRVTDLDGMDINYSVDRDDSLMLRRGFLASMNDHVRFLAKFRRFLPENGTKA